MATRGRGRGDGWGWRAAALGLLALALPAARFALSQGAAPPAVRAPDAKAAAPLAEQPAAGGKKPEEEPVHIENADLVQYDPDKKVYTLTGNVHLRQKDADFYADVAEYNSDLDTARATGHLKVTSPEAKLTGDLITADFAQKTVDITGNVRLEAQRKKKAAEGETKAGEAPKPEAPVPAEKKPGEFDKYQEKLTIVTCEHIRYWYEVKRAIATGNVVGVQEDKTGYADEAVYLNTDKEETLTLNGNPVRLVMKNGDQIEMPQVTIDLQTEKWWAEKGFNGVFKREKKEEGGAAPAPAPAAPAAPETKTPPPPAAKP